MKAALKSGNFCMVLAVAVSCTRLVGAAPLTLTWSGGSSGNLSDETWDGGVEGHFSPQNGDTLEFSTGGTFTSDVAGLEVAALTFSSSSAVTISGSEKITVQCGGQVRTTGSGAVTISAPIQAGEADGAAVTFAAAGSGCALTISGVISGATPVTVGAANGTVTFSGSNTFTGKLTVNNGFFVASNENALGLGTTEASFATGNGDGRAKVTFGGVKATMPIKVTAGNVSEEITFARSSSNTFLGDFTVLSKSVYFKFLNFATAVFSNKFEVANYLQGSADGGSRMEFWGENSWINTYAFSMNGSSANKCNLVVGKPIALTNWDGNGVRINGAYNILTMHTDNAFTKKSEEIAWTVLRFNAVGTTSTTFDMNGHSQTFVCIADTPKSSSNVIKSSKDCTLRLKQNWAELNEKSPVIREFGGAIQGKVAVSVEGSDPFILSGPNTTTGAMTLTNFANVAISSTGTWGGTNYVVSGGSTLAISNAAAVAADSAFAIIDQNEANRSRLVLGDVSLNAANLAVTVNGRRLRGGVWGSSESGAANVDDEHFAGPGTILLAASSGGTEEATWDADGGADERVSKAVNWDGDILPDFEAGSLLATFASSGTNAVVDTDVDFKGLVFSGVSNFALSDNGSAAATLDVSGLSATFAHTVTLDVPLQLTAAQTWNVAEGGVVSVKKLVSSDAPWALTKTGAGTLALRSPSSFTGDFTVNNGTVEVYAPTNAFGSGAVTFVERTEAKTTLSKVAFKENTTVANPFTFKYYTSLADGISVADGKTVYFTAPVSFTTARSAASWCDGTVLLSNGGQMVFSNGLDTVYLTVNSTGSLESRFAARTLPMAAQRTFYLKNTVVLELGAAGNTFTNAVVLNGWKTGLDFGADWAISNSLCSVYTGTSVSWRNWIRLNGHSQQVGTFYTRSGDSGTIESQTPAMWNFMAPSGGTTNATVKFTGFAGLGLYGGGTYAINCAMTSKGDVDVSGGTLEFLSGGSWLNGTNLTVRGTGVLKTASSNTFAETTILRVDSNLGAKVVLADGVEQKVRHMFLDGTEMRRGLYGGANAPVPESNRLSCFDSSSTGVIRVMRCSSEGMTLILR